MFAQKVAQNISGKFGVIRAKIPRTPKNLPAPTSVGVGSMLLTLLSALEMARAANSPVFGQSAKGFETVR